MTADKDKRRAVSREAARRRRCVESALFGDLSRLLPVPPRVRDSLDKPTVIRLTLSYMRLHQIFRGHTWTEASEPRHELRPDLDLTEEHGPVRDTENGTTEDGDTEGPEEPEESRLVLEILEGFLMILNPGGLIIFTSPNVSAHTGLTQTELMGHSIFEFTHPSDHQDIRTSLRLSPEEVWCGATRDFVIRIKSSQTHKARSTNLKSATFKVVHCRGRGSECCLLLLCQSLPLPHSLLETHAFTSQHSMDMRFTHCDHRVTLLLGYRPEELLGQSIYELCHTLDTSRLTKNHINLFMRSQSVSGLYRILVRGGGYVWVETHSAVIPVLGPHKSRDRERTLCIFCVTYVLSGVEQPSLQFSLNQTMRPNLAAAPLMVNSHSKKVVGSISRPKTCMYR